MITLTAVQFHLPKLIQTVHAIKIQHFSSLSIHFRLHNKGSP